MNPAHSYGVRIREYDDQQNIAILLDESQVEYLKEYGEEIEEINQTIEKSILTDIEESNDERLIYLRTKQYSVPDELQQLRDMKSIIEDSIEVDNIMLMNYLRIIYIYIYIREK